PLAEAACGSGADRTGPGTATARRAALVGGRPTAARPAAAAPAHTGRPLAGGVRHGSAGRARAVAGAAPGRHHPARRAGPAAPGPLLPGIPGLGPDIAVALSRSHAYGSAQRQPHRHRLLGR